MPKHKNLFDEESEEEDDFRINEDYASRYDKWRTKEEYEKLKARAPLLESSSDESSDEEPGDKDFGKPNNPEFDREFLLSLGTIYKHEKGEVDVQDVQFFTGDYRLEKEKEEKPMTIKDFERHVMVDREGKFEENEIDTRKIEVFTKDTKRRVKLDDGLDSDEEGDDLLTSGLFKVKEDSDKGTKEDMNEAPGNEAVDFVKGLSSTVYDSKHQDILETVKDAWTNENLSKKDKWLVDFFLNKRYLAESSDDEGYCNENILDEEQLSEEQETNESDPLSTQYKFRHEEPGDLIKRHPRSVPDSIRLKDERRKERRDVAKQRQLMKKEEKRKEIELLKAMKYKEIQDKIDKIKEVSGNEDIDLGEIDLEADFDPSAHDAYMERMLGESYYEASNAEEEIPDFEEEFDDSKIYDNWTKPSTSYENDKFEGGGEEKNWEESYYDEDFNMDADNDPQNHEEVVEKKQIKSNTRRKTRHRSKFARALEKNKPLFDPNEKDFASYFDEYYKLDFEDVVAGIPCRFKYRKVECNNFGLTTGEILTAQNSDLNRWVGLKKIMQYNRSNELEAKERMMYGDRAKHIHVKQKKLPSLFDENPEDLAEREREKRRMKNLKRKQKKWKLREETAGDTENLVVAEGTSGNNSLEERKTKNEYNKRPIEDSEQNLPRKKHILEEGNEGETINQPGVLEENKSKKKKKKKREQIEDVQSSPTSENLKKEKENAGKYTLNNTVDQLAIKEKDLGTTKKKKKKKKKCKDQIGEPQSTPTTSKSPEENEELDSEVEGESIVQKEKKKKKKKHKVQAGDMQNKPTKESLNKKRKFKRNENISNKRKEYHKKHNKAIPYFQGISDARLEAYGQNPKKLKNRVIYGKDF